MIREFLKNRDGATPVEYGLIAALISVVLIAALHAFFDRPEPVAVSVPAQSGSLYTQDSPQAK